MPTLFDCLMGCLFFMYLSSCDAYKKYAIVNETEDQILLWLDDPVLTLDYNRINLMDSSGLLLIKPDQKCVLFTGINELDRKELTFSQLLVLSKEQDTLFYFKDEDEILKYFKSRAVLSVE